MRSTTRQVSVVVLATFMVAGIGTLDYWTGYRLGVSLFYLVPVLLASWLVGRWAGLLCATISMLAWLVADASLRAEGFVNPVVYWNGLMRFGYFCTGAYLLSALKMALDRERQAGRIDLLSGLFNSRAFYESAEAELGRARRNSSSITVGYIDLDNFKMVNDLYGHREGDRLIAQTGQVIRSALRRHDVAARLGGDEFIVMLPETGADEAKSIFNRLTDMLQEKARAEEKLRHVTASVGVVTFNTAPASTAAMVWAADVLMYKVKHTGKNGCNFEVEEGGGSAQSRLMRARQKAGKNLE